MAHKKYKSGSKSGGVGAARRRFLKENPWLTYRDRVLRDRKWGKAQLEEEDLIKRRIASLMDKRYPYHIKKKNINKRKYDRRSNREICRNAVEIDHLD